jgi:hypothetical protein
MKHSLTTTLSFVNENIRIEGDSSGSKSSYGPMLHSYIWMPYTAEVKTEEVYSSPLWPLHGGIGNFCSHNNFTSSALKVTFLDATHRLTCDHFISIRSRSGW